MSGISKIPGTPYTTNSVQHPALLYGPLAPYGSCVVQQFLHFLPQLLNILVRFEIVEHRGGAVLHPEHIVQASDDCPLWFHRFTSESVYVLTCIHISIYRYVHICARVARTRKTYNITLPDDVEKWLARKVNDRTYANRSHGIEVAVRRLMKEEDKKK